MVCFFTNIKNSFIEIRQFIKQYKLHFCLCLAIMFFAMMFALNKSSQVIEIYYSPNFYVLIVRKVFNPLAFTFKLLLLSLILYSLLYLMSIHYGFYVFGYVILFLGVYYGMLPIFCSGIRDGFSGQMLAIFCYIPICILTVYFYSLGMIKIYILCNYSHDYKHFNDVRYLFKSILKEIFYPYVSNALCCYIWWLIIFFIVIAIAR